jgi:hypothetical protein
MENKEIVFIANGQKVEVENYPYGFKLRTTLFDTVDFSMSKGFRHVTQTINPKNGALNKPKKSTYYPLMLRYFDEKNHVKTWASHANGDKELNSSFKFIGKHYNMFSNDEKEYIRALFMKMIRVSLIATTGFTNVPKEVAEEVYLPLFNKLKENESLENVYSDMKVDTEKLNKENREPVKMEVVSTMIIG